jgi:PKD repeat protein
VLSDSDETTIVVNEPPAVRINSPGDPQRKLDSNEKEKPYWELELNGEITTGLGDPFSDSVVPQWSVVGRGASIKFSPLNIERTRTDNDQVMRVRTTATFQQSGNYLLKLGADNGSFTRDAQIMVAIAARVTAGLQALYTFEEKEGLIVPEVSGLGAPLDLTVKDATAIRWVPGGLAIESPTILTSNGSIQPIAEAIKATDEITVEAWIKPAATDNPGLARILTFSNGPAARNFTLGQSGNSYYIGLRTTTTNNNASNKVLAGGVADPGKVSQVVYSRDRDGLSRLYVNGVEITHRLVDGNFSKWDSNFKLALGNELESNDGHDRAWLGEFHLVAVYNRALSLPEVRQNFEFGADSDLPPLVSAGVYPEINWDDSQSQKCSLQLAGKVVHDRPPSPKATVTWTQVGGPNSLDGVVFSDRNVAATTATFKPKGRYVLRLTADDGELMAVDEAVVIVNKVPQVTILVASPLALTRTEVATELSVKKITDTGLPDEPQSAPLSFAWSGPKNVRFTNANQPQATATFTARGVYALKLTVNNGRLSKDFPISIIVNQLPAVGVDSKQVKVVTLPTAAGAGQTVPQAQVVLNGAIKDSGLGDPQDKLLIQWKQTKGPEQAIITPDATKPAVATATFIVGGIYEFELTATNPGDRSLTASTTVTITVNRAPVVDAGPEQTVLLPAQGQLDRTVSDDGLPEQPGTVTLKWSKVSGSGSVTFADDGADYITARFSEKGIYELQLTASDGAVSVADTVKLSVHAAPKIEAGGRQRIRLGASTELRGQVLDDGLAEPQLGMVTKEWTQLSGPATVSIEQSAAEITRVTGFTQRGIYTFQFRVANGYLSAIAQAQIVVTNRVTRGLQASYAFE